MPIRNAPTETRLLAVNGSQIPRFEMGQDTPIFKTGEDRRGAPLFRQQADKRTDPSFILAEKLPPEASVGCAMQDG